MSEEQPYYSQLTAKDVHVMYAMAGIAKFETLDFPIENVTGLLKNQILTANSTGIHLTKMGANVLQNYFENTTLQVQIQHWAQEALGEEPIADVQERCARLNEEVAELLQSCNYTFKDYIRIGTYVWARDVGEKAQEVGGVFTTFAVLCSALKLDMLDCARIELKRIWSRLSDVREKQKSKPHATPLPSKFSNS